MPSQQRDVFICHASEDKDAIARPLAEALRERGHAVWFDEFELEIGDSLRQEIDRGLARSRFGVVILSPSFFEKKWAQRELDGLTAREMMSGADKVILPVWHEVDHDHVARYSPPLADKLAAQSGEGVPAIVEHIERVLSRDGRGGGSPESVGRPATPRDGGGVSAAPVTGETMLGHLLENNTVAARESMRSGRAALEQEARKLTSERYTSEPALKAELPGISHAMAGMVDQIVPLICHRSTALVAEQAGWLGRLASARYTESGVAAWVELPKWMAWCISQACGAYALCVEDLDSVHALLAAPVDHRIPGVAPKPLACIGPGHTSQVAGEIRGNGSPSAWFEQWADVLSADRNLQRSAAELYERADEGPRYWLLAYSFLATAFSGLHGEHAAAPWTAYADGGHYALANRLQRDAAYAKRLAETVFECTPEVFRSSADDWLRTAVAPYRPSIHVRSPANLQFDR
jgi:hypothetical protein